MHYTPVLFVTILIEIDDLAVLNEPLHFRSFIGSIVPILVIESADFRVLLGDNLVGFRLVVKLRVKLYS